MKRFREVKIDKTKVINVLRIIGNIIYEIALIVYRLIVLLASIKILLL